MKIKTIFKTFAALGITTAAGLSIGLFVDLVPTTTSNVKILTKETYQKLIKDSPSTTIDYGLLPTSQYSFRDILDNPKSVNNGNFIFYFGSQAYKNTNQMLWGIDKAYTGADGQPANYAFSMMDKLYSTFWGDNAKALGLDKVNPIFLNYVDMVNTKEIRDAWNLKVYRGKSLGNFVTNEAVYSEADKNPAFEYEEWTNPINGSKVWYKIDKFFWGVGEGRDIRPQEVVKGVKNIKSPELTKFDFTPDPNTFYEWRPNDGKDTEYEKVYYRNTHEVQNFNSNFAFMEAYLNNVYGKSGANKEGMILCVRNLDPSKYEKETISNPFDIKVISTPPNNAVTLGEKLDEIIEFYNPDYLPDQDQPSDSNTDAPAPAPEPSPAPSPAPTTYKLVNQQEYKINQLSDNLGEMNKNLATVEVKK